MTNELKIPIETARIICKMDEDLFNDGIGPIDSASLMVWIVHEYPELLDEFYQLKVYVEPKGTNDYAQAIKVAIAQREKENFEF